MDVFVPSTGIRELELNTSDAFFEWKKRKRVKHVHSTEERGQRSQPKVVPQF